MKLQSDLSWFLWVLLLALALVLCSLMLTQSLNRNGVWPAYDQYHEQLNFGYPQYAPSPYAP